ncbi:LOW QUALITY PROTEIN: ras-associating and dilute domain-containing protein [Notothenia coriiceps]|uniref:Ras-associating and dilute domain-containing protein n=1 Tax=Notothenia coriiceps TaxID=8208 RepID=A0A6I9PM30_9TELE|nr:PREDICTED: LOW QUALITY PROTEIN: ras-associating and dilute domain-containing protein [Notothenia coriiceps]
MANMVLYRTLSYRDRVPVETGTNTRGDRRSTTEPPERPTDDPAELSTQSSAPGVLKIFGDEICAGANYKSVLATPRSSAQELVKEALDRYSLNKNAAHSYVLCDVIGRLEGEGGIGEGGWRTECLRAMGDNEKPLLLQELWKPREGHARRFELRRRAEVEEFNAKEKDTITAGPSRGWFQRSKVLQIQACLRMVMEWASKSGLGHLADKFFTKLNSAVSILATPPQQLTQLSWRALSSEHPALKPVQLHRILTQYQLTAEIGPVPSWQPSSEDEAYIYRTVDLLESFENHPPIVLPSGGFRVDLESECVEDSIYRQLLYIRHYLWGLRTKTQTHANTPSVHTHSNGTNTADWPDVQRESLPPAHSSPRSGGPGEEVTGEPGEDRARERPPGQSHTHSLRRNGTIHHARTANPDPSCLLTPTNTPLYPDEGRGGGGGGGGGKFIGPIAQTNGCGSRTVAECKKTNGLISNGLEGCISGCEFPFPVSSPGAPPLPDDLCVVFVVELDKGPYGLGMGLIDGLHTPLNAPGIYIRTLIPDGPASSDGRLRIGDRILAVNGTSLIGADYQSAVDLIRLGGGRLRFLVAKSDPDVSEKISASSC